MELNSKRCPTCVGSGEIMGSGFIFKDCHACDGLGKIYERGSNEPKKVEIDRRSKSYRESIAKIMAADNCSREEAVAMFDAEFAKI